MRVFRSLIILTLILGITGLAYCEEFTKRTAKVSEMKGIVEVKNQAGEVVPAAIGMLLNEGDIISTKSESTAVLNVDGTAQTASVEIRPNTQLKLAELLENKADGTQATLLDLSLGEVLIKAKKLHSEKSRFEVKTPTSIVGVKGTTFSVSVEAVE